MRQLHPARTVVAAMPSGTNIAAVRTRGASLRVAITPGEGCGNGGGPSVRVVAVAVRWVGLVNAVDRNPHRGDPVLRKQLSQAL